MLALLSPRHIIVTDWSRTRRLAEGERTQSPQAELHQPSPYSDLESESMCRAMRHSAIITWSQNSRVFIIVLISPKLEWVTKVSSVLREYVGRCPKDVDPGALVLVREKA
jgi:hypothetical protein